MPHCIVPHQQRQGQGRIVGATMTAAAGGAACAVGAGEFVPHRWCQDDCIVLHKAEPTNVPRYAPVSLVKDGGTSVPTASL